MKLKSLVFVITTLLIANQVQAATIYVTTTLDVLDSNTSSPDGVCSLREATININDQALTYTNCTDSTSDGFGTNDTIVLASGSNYILSLTDSTSDTDEVNDLDLSNDFTLTTNSTAQATITANFSAPNEYTRILTGYNINNTTLENIDFAGGELSFSTTYYENATGGNVYLSMLGGDTNITNCIFRDATITSTSTMASYGAGLSYRSHSNSTAINTLTISQSEFYNNTITTQSTSGANGYAIGAGAYLRNNSSFDAIYNISETSFYTNESSSPASSASGIGLHITDFNEGTISNSYFHSNNNLGGSNNSILYLYNNNVSTATNHTISQSTFSNNTNQASNLNGSVIECFVYDSSGPDLNLHILNSTVSQNSYMTGISSLRCNVKLSHSTIYENTNSNGGGLKNSIRGEFHLINTIVANNTLTNGSARDCTFSGDVDIYSYGSNFISESSTCYLTNVSSNQPDDILDQPLTLASLADNGGDTPTHAFDASDDSVVDQGTCLDVDGNSIATDQRGYPRTENCDIGAYEQYLPDSDSDGYGDGTLLGDTTYDSSYVNRSNDCDDDESTTNPGEADICSDSVDNDCDGETDEIEDEICDDNIDNDCDGFEDDDDPEGCEDPNPSSSGGGTSHSGGSNSSNNNDGDDVTCAALTPECMGEEAYQEYLDSLEESENQAAGAGGCGCNVASQVPVSPITIFLSLGVFVSLFALRLQQKRS